MEPSSLSYKRMFGDPRLRVVTPSRQMPENYFKIRLDGVRPEDGLRDHLVGSVVDEQGSEISFVLHIDREHGVTYCTRNGGLLMRENGEYFLIIEVE